MDTNILGAEIVHDLYVTHSELEGLYTLVSCFYRDSIQQGYNTPKDLDEQIELFTSVFPTIIRTISSTMASIDKAALDVDELNSSVMKYFTRDEQDNEVIKAYQDIVEGYRKTVNALDAYVGVMDKKAASLLCDTCVKALNASDQAELDAECSECSLNKIVESR